MTSISDLPKTGRRFLTTYQFAKDPFSCYRKWKASFGNTFLVNALNGDVVVLCDRNDIRKLFSASFDDVLPFAIETIAPLVGRRSIFLIEGEEHRKERALLSPPFHGKCMFNKAGEIQQIAINTAKKLQAGKEFLVMDAALDVSLEVIIQIIFGVQSTKAVEEFKSATKDFVRSFHPILAFTKLFHRPLFGLSPWNRFAAQRKKFYSLLTQQIIDHQHSRGDDDSVLSQLIQSRYDDGSSIEIETVCDQLVSMLFAGHETTQIAIAWAMSWLHRYPEYATQLRSELDQDDFFNAVFESQLLTGICNESLRLNSVVSDTIRKLRVPMEFSEVSLPPLSNIAIPICLVHEDPELYPDPFQFKPERWTQAQMKPFEFLPFGGGVRRCIGAPLAMMELKLVIATWIKNFDFELPEKVPSVERTYRRNITMAPKSGIPLKFIGERKTTALAQL